MEENVSPFEKFDGIQVTTQARDILKEAAKWANIVSIFGYIGLGCIVLAAIIMLFVGSSASMMSNSLMPFGGTAILTVFYLVFAALYFFPIYYLNKFASFAKRAVQSNNANALTDALTYLKSHYKFIGIMMIVVAGFYVFMFLIGIFGGLMGALGR